MSVLIATPCYGGQMTVGYFRGFMDINMHCAAEEIELDILANEGESLVSRARNTMVATFLHQTDCDTLAFIDADVEMRGDDFVKLAKMDGVRGAAVPMKTPDHSEWLSVWKDGEKLERGNMGREKLEVDYIGAAVLFIPREILETIYAENPEWQYDIPGVGPGCAMFVENIVAQTYLSEDYGFCHLLRNMGVPIYCDPTIVVKHYGQSVWSA